MVYIITYGCKVNYAESEAVATLLSAAGVPNELVSDGAISRLGAADAFVVNSCAVTGMAEKKSRYGIAKIKKYHPQAKIVTMGCALGRKSPEAVADEVLTALNVETAENLSNNDEWGKGVIQQASNGAVLPCVQHRREVAYVKVQDGCQNFCTYCIIPYKRNVLTCQPIDAVVAEINAQPPKVTEIVLCGINLCYYANFGELCRAVDACGRRWRISSLEPPMLTPELLGILRDCRNFEPHFHICLQSGCDRVLAAMNRHYTAADYAKIVEMVRNLWNNAAIATDIIVGFPGETNADFAETCRFLAALKLDKLHIFPYSPRTGTVAATMKPVPNAIVTKRVRQLSSL